MNYSSKHAELEIFQERITSQIGRDNFSTLATPVTDIVSANRKVRHADSLVLALNPAITDTTAQLSYLNALTNRQKDTCEAYWYHPDHLGSSSWITYSDGSVVQHLHYLPWGEDFVDQRTTNWHAMHTFSAKERDSETGFSYFGSRYYSSDLSIWLSVDPQASKYPSLSPYVYCADNPIKLVDPEGEEIYEYDESGKFLCVRGETGSADQIAIKKSDGSVVMSKEYKNGTIKLGIKGFAKQESGESVKIQALNIQGDDNAIECFKFVADNSNCEWSLCQIGSQSGENGKNVMSNSQEREHESSASLIINSYSNIRAHWHSQPDDLKVSSNDYKASEALRNKCGNPFSPMGYIPTYIYSKGKHIQYNNFIKFLDEKIEKSIQDFIKRQ
jgi:RHS repeat-associated protein